MSGFDRLETNLSLLRRLDLDARGYSAAENVARAEVDALREAQALLTTAATVAEARQLIVQLIGERAARAVQLRERRQAVDQEQAEIRLTLAREAEAAKARAGAAA